MTLTFLPANTSLTCICQRFGRLTNCLPVGNHQDVLGDSLQVAAKLSFRIGNPTRFFVIVRLLTVLCLYVWLHFQPRRGVCKITSITTEYFELGYHLGLDQSISWYGQAFSLTGETGLLLLWKLGEVGKEMDATWLKVLPEEEVRQAWYCLEVRSFYTSLLPCRSTPPVPYCQKTLWLKRL